MVSATVVCSGFEVSKHAFFDLAVATVVQDSFSHLGVCFVLPVCRGQSPVNLSLSPDIDYEIGMNKAGYGSTVRKIRLAAATNEVIARDHGLELLLAFGASFLLIALTYRSLVVGALLIASLATAAVATLSIQALLGIGLQIHTLPVQAIGIGVGVDYAIYVVDRIRRERGRGLEIGAAIERAVNTTGVAVIFTASTLVAAIASWIPLSSLRFGAEMALLLCLLMAINAVTAVVLVPALMRWVPERVWSERP